MRRSSDLPVDRPRSRVSGRGILIVLGGILLFIMIFGRAIARFYVDFLWHDALGRNDVFWGAIGAKATLFFGFFTIFALLAGVNLYLADRSAPETFPANVHPYVERFHEIFGRRLRLVRYAAAGLFALMLAAPAIARWQEWLLFRNSQSFGTADAQFGRDVGFYVFELPFLTFLLDWMFAAVVVVLLLTIAAHILNGGVVFVSPVPVVRAATRTHVAVLLALLAVLKAGDYWLDRYELTNAQTGIVQGATYSVVQARLPALMLLILVAGLTAVLYLSVARTGSFRAPVIASALWLVVSIVGGVIYPAIIQGLVVNPDQEAKEAEFIERNVNATRQAYGLSEVDVRLIEFGELTSDEVERDLDAFENVRLLNPEAMRDRFVFDRSDVSELTIDDLDVDREAADQEQVFVAALELDLAGIPNRSWQGLHLLNTRGCGMVQAPANEVTARGQRPVYEAVQLDRPELYLSPSLTGYAITNTASNERECNGEAHEYEGELGVGLSSFARRAAFSLAFLDLNLLLSGAIDSDSQMLWVRGVNDRLNKLAPFLSYDADPYPVAMDGRVNWVVDAYTTTSRYPYAESVGDVERSRGSGIRSNDNYVRNSVKVLVDGYSGDVTFYVVDETDPILQAWRSAFPDLFTDNSEIPDELRDHLRYPEDLFRVQTERYSKYRISAEQFFDRQGAWSVAQAAPGSPSPATTTGAPTDGNVVGSASRNTFAVEADTARFAPYFTYLDMSREDEPADEEFVLLRPFVEFSTDNSRTQLQAYMTASSEPDNYGQLTTFVVQPGDDNQLPDGPLRVASDAESTEQISLRISRDSEGGTGVVFGDLQLVPVADGLVYVRPYYVTVSQTGSRVSQTTEFREVIVSYNGEAVLARTITDALEQLFPGFDGVVSGEVPIEGDAGAVPLDENSEEVLLRLNTLLAEADAALEDGNLGTYQEKVNEANELLADAIERLELQVDEAENGDDTESGDDSDADDADDEASDTSDDETDG